MYMNKVQTRLQTQVVLTLEAMAEDQGYSSVRSWYDSDNLIFRCQLGITEPALMARLDKERRLPEMPVDELARRIVARQVGKGLRRYGRRPGREWVMVNR